MSTESPETAPTAAEDSSEIIIIHDPEVDVEALMQQVRANVAQRRAAGAYQEDLDAIADEVRAQVLGSLDMTPDVEQQAGFPLLTELQMRWLIREPDFSSRAPVIGPLIIAIRRGWNWMSTKWYVRGILDQQIGFNAMAVQTLGEMHGAQQALTAKVTELEALCAEQQEEIVTLRERLAEQDQARASRRGIEA